MKSLSLAMTALALTLAVAPLRVSAANEEPGAQQVAAPPPPAYYPPTAASGATPVVAIEALPLAVNREAAPATAPALSAPTLTAPAQAAAASAPVAAETSKPAAAVAPAIREPEPLKAEAAKVDAVKTGTVKATAAKTEASKPEAHKAAALEEADTVAHMPLVTSPSPRRGKRAAPTPPPKPRQLAAVRDAPPLMPIARCTGLCGRFILIGVGF
jgi:hypothetical protein